MFIHQPLLYSTKDRESKSEQILHGTILEQIHSNNEKQGFIEETVV